MAKPNEVWKFIPEIGGVVFASNLGHLMQVTAAPDSERGGEIRILMADVSRHLMLDPTGGRKRQLRLPRQPCRKVRGYPGRNRPLARRIGAQVAGRYRRTMKADRTGNRKRPMTRPRKPSERSTADIVP